MNKIIKDDILELIKRFKRAKNDKEKILCASDLSNILDAAGIFDCDINFETAIPTEFATSISKLEDVLKEERDNFTKQIYDHLDELENLYLTFIREFRKYDFTYIDTKSDKDIELDHYYEFFNQFGNMTDEFRKILNNERLFIIDGNKGGCTINFKRLDKQYIFIPSNNFGYAARSIAHEMGHVHAFNITYDDKVDDFNFMTEFMSFLIELSYINSENSELTNQDNINVICILALLVYQSLGQIRLMKKYPDAFETFKLNPKYEKELDELCKVKYKFHRDELYSQIYTIDYLIAINFYYQLKYGVDFNDIEKFYIENNCKNDLPTLLKNIDMDAVKQYLNELHYDRQKKKR